MFLIHGKDPLLDVNNGPKLLFSTPKELNKQVSFGLALSVQFATSPLLL
jgi:hypothetical protein